MIVTVLQAIASLLTLVPGFAATAKAFYDDIAQHQALSAEDKAKLLALKKAQVDAEDDAVQAVDIPAPAPTAR